MLDDFSDTTVILPTLNESGNIEKIIGKLVGQYKRINIVVVDDGSVDGTLDKTRLLAGKNNKIRIVDRSDRKEHGLTASVIEAATQVATPNIIVMDADMQHPVEKVGKLRDALDDYDLAVAVRTKVRSWGFDRKFISKSVGAMSYLVFKFRNKRVCNDMLSGFFGIRTNVFKLLIKKNKDVFVGKGYKVLLDILRILDNDSSIGEVYYSTFHERKEGKSKFVFKHVIYTLKSIYKVDS